MSESPFVRPAGFSAWHGGTVSEAQRLGGLVSVFARDLRRGLLRTLLWLAFALPALGVTVYAVARFQITAFAVPAAEEAAFALQTLGLVFGINAAWALLLQAGLVAPTLARDLRFGALLLYFSRPVRRRHYLFGRVIAGTLLASAGVGLPLLGLALVLLVGLGLQPGGAGPLAASWLFWPVVFAAVTVASLVAALLSTVVGLAGSVLARSPGRVPLYYGVLVLGSVGMSWVGQLIWGRNSYARSVDLHHGLSAAWTLLTRWVDTASTPDFVLLDAAAGLGLWALLALVSWLLLDRFMKDPPLGRGRS